MHYWHLYIPVTKSSHLNPSLTSMFSWTRHCFRRFDSQPSCDRYRSGIELAGGIPRYVPLHPPKNSSRAIASASEWTVDFEELEKAINKNTKMIVWAISFAYPLYYLIMRSLTKSRYSTRRMNASIHLHLTNPTS